MLKNNKVLLKLLYGTMKSSKVKMNNKLLITQQKRDKKTKSITVPSKIELVALGSGYGGTSKCLIVNMNHFKYMFNCGEGTQRVSTEHKRMRGVSQIFITHGSWSNIGGLMGLCLTLETAEVPSINLHGVPGIEHHILSSRKFSQLHAFDLIKKELTDGPHEDSAMLVQPLPINYNPVTSYRGRGQETYTETKQNVVASAVPSTPLKESLFSDRRMAVAYLCKPHPKPRNVDLEKCVDLNLPVGPHLAKLKNGESIPHPVTGKTINPDDILSPVEENKPFLVVECPSLNHLDSLLTCQKINDFHFSNATGDKNLCLVVHFTHSSIMSSPPYLDWMRRFGQETEHLILNDLSCPLDTEAGHKLQTQLNMLSPHVFPLLKHDTDYSTGEQLKIEDLRIVYAQTNTRYLYRPATHTGLSAINNDLKIQINHQEYRNEVFKDEERAEFFKNLQRDQPPPPEPVEIKNGFPQILFLGTGSAVPNKYRNVSGISLTTSEDRHMLLDCGENTYGQLCRFYGQKKAESFLKNLRAVFISHLHADHHMGLIGVAMQRCSLSKGSSSSSRRLTNSIDDSIIDRREEEQTRNDDSLPSSFPPSSSTGNNSSDGDLATVIPKQPRILLDDDSESRRSSCGINNGGEINRRKRKKTASNKEDYDDDDDDKDDVVIVGGSGNGSGNVRDNGRGGRKKESFVDSFSASSSRKGIKDCSDSEEAGGFGGYNFISSSSIRRRNTSRTDEDGNNNLAATTMTETTKVTTGEEGEQFKVFNREDEDYGRVINNGRGVGYGIEDDGASSSSGISRRNTSRADKDNNNLAATTMTTTTTGEEEQFKVFDQEEDDGGVINNGRGGVGYGMEEDGRLIVLAPMNLYKWYESLHSDQLPVLDWIRFIPLEHIQFDRDMPSYLTPIYQFLLSELQLTKCHSVYVEHVQSPHGIVIQCQSGFKLVYSGDTMPSGNLVEAGKDCDLLIHEATFDDYKIYEAKDKKHSTTGQAISVGKMMNAKHTILTHFSQRYDRIPLVTPDFDETVSFAFDNMKVCSEYLNKFHELVPQLKVLFNEEYRIMLADIENKNIRKQLIKDELNQQANEQLNSQ